MRVRQVWSVQGTDFTDNEVKVLDRGAGVRVRCASQLKRVLRARLLFVSLVFWLVACQVELVPVLTPTPTATPTSRFRTVPFSIPTPGREGSGSTPTVRVRQATPTPLSTPSPSPPSPSLPTPTSVPTRPPGAGLARPSPSPSPRPSPTVEEIPIPTPESACQLLLNKTVVSVRGELQVLVTLTLQHTGERACPSGIVVRDLLPAGMTQQEAIHVVEAGGSAGWSCEGTECRTANEILPGYAATLSFAVSVEAGQTYENCAELVAAEGAMVDYDRKCATVGPIVPTPTPTPAATPTPPICSLQLEKQMARQQQETALPLVTLVLRVMNHGPANCSLAWPEVALVDVPPAELVLREPVTVTDSQWSCLVSGNALQCSGPPPQPGTSVTIRASALMREQQRDVLNCASLEPLELRACATVTEIR